MTIFIIFVGALIAVVVLFFVKEKEMRKGEALFAQGSREALNTQVTRLEQRFLEVCTRENAWYVVKHIYNTITHKFAKVTASLAKKIEWRARSVAHKSAKAQQEGGSTRENGYLKNVQDHKESLDLQEVAEQHKL